MSQSKFTSLLLNTSLIDCRGYRVDDCRSYTSSSGAENPRVDPQLDTAMMQTIIDVKYVKRRPKFTAVGGFISSWSIQCLFSRRQLPTTMLGGA
jgi:hypothetical protein